MNPNRFSSSIRLAAALGLGLVLVTGNLTAQTPVAYYSFDSDFSDASGNANDLSVANGTPVISTTAGEHVFGGGALDLENSAGEYLSLTTGLPFASTDAWSVSFWAKRRAGAGTATGMVLGENGVNGGFIWNTANDGQVSGGDGTGGLRFRPSSVSTGSGNNDYATGTDTSFHHWALVADGAGNLTVYQDNVSLGSAVANPDTEFTINAIGNAYSGTSLTFDGQIDEVYIYDVAIDAAKVAELFSGSSTLPTLSGSDFVDDRAGGPVEVNSLVTYTVSFDKDMDDSTVDASDFGNAGGATFGIGTVTETAPGIFSVPVTPTGAGTLQLQVNQSAVLTDTDGNDLDTASAIADVTVITVELADTTPPSLVGGDIGDDQSGGPVIAGTTVTFTLSFSEDMDDSTVDAADVGNAGTAGITIGAITEISPGVFTVEVTPSSGGTLQLSVLALAELDDASGNPLDTASAILDETVITVQAGFTPAGVKRLRVVLVGGQSNADGRAATSGLPTSPVNLQQPQDDVDFFYRVEGTIFPLTTLRPGLSETSGFGPAITLGRTLADELADGISTRVAVIKYANGGTNLSSQWAAGGDATTSSDGTQYVRFQETVTAGLAALAAEYPNAAIDLVGMIWLQGESDAGGGAASYETNLTNFIADIRLTYGAELPFVVIRLSSGQTAVNATGLATIRTAQTNVAAADPLAGLVDTDGFGMKADNLHFDATGQQQIGDASACEILAFHPFLSPATIAPLSGGDVGVTIEDAFDGFVYTLQSNPTLAPGLWTDVEDITASGDTVDFSYTPGVGEEVQFLRVERTKAP